MQADLTGRLSQLESSSGQFNMEPEFNATELYYHSAESYYTQVHKSFLTLFPFLSAGVFLNYRLEFLSDSIRPICTCR